MSLLHPPGAPSTQPRGAVDLDRFRLRSYLAALGPDELEVRDEAIDLVDVARVFEGNPRAVLLRRVGPEGAELVGNVVGRRTRIARAFGVAPADLLPEVTRRLRSPQPIIEVGRDQAPVQEVVRTGDEVDLTRLPVHVQHGYDGGPYISASVDYSIDRRTGLTNVGMRRLMLRGVRETGIDVNAPSDLRAIYEASARRGENLPIAFAVGSHPIDHVAAVMRLPGDELEILAALRGAPLGVVKCITNDIRVPADSEWIIEGYLDAAGMTEPEGPYGEFLGYYGAVKKNPIFRVTAITRRRDALFQTSTIGGRSLGLTDTAQLNAIRTEVMVWRSLETAVREPLAVYATPSSGGAYNVRIALRQRVPGEARNAIAAAFSCLANVKHVFVVDPDIDVFSDEQIDWALATRFQGDRDLVVQSDMRAVPIDPSLEGARTTAKAGFDLTVPFGGRGIETMVPEPPTFEGKRFASVRAALEDGPKRFEELVAAIGSRDGRDVVRELETLRAHAAIGRDAEGRYLLE
jgi:2,5-furandicarboxylate decarboxylase 1